MIGRVSTVRLALTTATIAAAVIAIGYGPGCNGGGNHSGPPPGAPAMDAAPQPTRTPYAGLPPSEGGPRTPVHAEFTSTPVRTDTMQLMFAAGEMQTSGEPFAQNFAGRNLFYYIPSRYSGTPDQYWIPGTSMKGGIAPVPPNDPFGFSTAVESYEYSKYHMNIVANQSGAGVSLLNGPLIATLPGASAFDKLRARMQVLIAATGADVSQFARLPAPANNPLNDFGFPGLWPNMAPYRSFDVTMGPSREAAVACETSDGGSTAHGYGGLVQFGGQAVPLYECDYNSLRLNDRSQAEHVIGPGIVGYATWKEALWAIDFVGRLHDTGANFVTTVAPPDMARVGQQGNLVQALDPKTIPGVFVGSTPLEGIWGLTMVEEMDNAGAWLLSSLATSDGMTLTGFPSVLAAITYDYNSPLLWFPTAVEVTEAAADPDGGDARQYPAVGGLGIQDATSRAVDLAALAQGYALFFGMTDERNAAVGQQIGMQAAFDGFVFPKDNGLPDGESSPHDRALGVMRVAFVDLDRIHADPSTAVIVDTATVSGGNVSRGSTTTTASIGHVVVGLRHLLMGCNAAVTQYGAPDSDPSKDDLGILNDVPVHPADADPAALPSFSARVRRVLMAQAEFVLRTVTGSDGSVRNGATLGNGQWTAMPDTTTLEAQSAAVRVLVEAWFLTHDTTYRDRARAVARKLLSTFWSDAARMFRGQAGGPDDVVMTPELFGWLQQALRETYKALSVPGDPLLDRSVLEDRIARVNKLYLNGWDDLNGDQSVQKPTECLGARLQLGEQALTGEIGTISNGHAILAGADIDSDCVLNIAFANAASVLAGQVHFHAP
jgi:hypothetical protein